MLRSLAVLALALVASSPAVCRAADGRTALTAVKAQHTVTLDDEQWSRATRVTGFTDVTLRAPAKRATSAWLLYDKSFVYVKFVCEQSDVPITASQPTNNVGFGVDDYVAVDLDTTNSGNLVYSFYTTPLGTRYQTSTESSRFNPTWDAVGRRSNGSWSALLTIPLASLRSSAGERSTWRVNFRRHLAANTDDYSWAYSASATSTSDSAYWPRLRGLDLPNYATRPLPHASLFVLESAGSDRERFAEGFNGFQQQPVRHAGLDVVFPLSNTFAAVGTLSPDYSNAETDQEIIAPQQFPQFLYEYRPFFAQGAQYLDPKEIRLAVNSPAARVFYTPSIGRIDAGLKLEGTLGPVGLGVLHANGPGIDDLAYGVKDSLANQQVKIWVNGVSARHDDVRDGVVEAGAVARNSRSGLLAGVDVASETGTAVPDAAQAKSADVTVGMASQSLSVFAVARSIGPYYAPLDGFTPYNDAHGLMLIANYQGKAAASSALRSYDLSFGADRFFDTRTAGHDPQVALADVALSGAVTFRSLLSLNASIANSEQRLYDQAYPVYANGETLPFRSTTFGLGYREGTNSSISGSYGFGPFGTRFVQQTDVVARRQLVRVFDVSGEYEAVLETGGGQPRSGQVLRRIALGAALGRNLSGSLALRTINGRGGFAAPGTNLSAGLRAHFRSGDDLFLNFGSPSANRTLDRLLVKYVFNVGGVQGS